MAARPGSAKIVDVSTTRASSLRHVRPVQPLRFPEREPDEERMPESRRHRNLCNALNEMLCALCVPEHTVGVDQFVYFDASNPGRCLAPDGFVTLGIRDHDFDSYKIWEEGTPDVAFEILSPSDSPERWTFEEKLLRYHALGVRELVVFHLEAEAGKRLRVWDRIDEDLVERVVSGETTPCLTLGVTLLVSAVNDLPLGLRLARDAEGKDLVPTAVEARRASDEARRASDEARAQAEARIAVLERELAARGPR
jgi:hypothetical protein